MLMLAKEHVHQAYQNQMESFLCRMKTAKNFHHNVGKPAIKLKKILELAIATG